MSRKRSKSSSILPVIILCVAVAVWVSDAYMNGSLRPFSKDAADRPSETKGIERSDEPFVPNRDGRYDVYKNCTLSSDRGNDGDSFRVGFPDGRTEIIRLYLVDAPESAFKTYGGGRNNHRRISQQAEDLGNITPQQAVGVGKEAKKFTLGLLSGARFTVLTEWDSPFNDRRYHAFVAIPHEGKARFLHELLTEKGYARIHTKGADMPNGTSERKQEEYLQDLQRIAKANREGAWGL